MLLSAASALQALARLLGPLATALAGLAAALLAVFWLGLTTLTLSFAATARPYSVRGRNRLLFQFADSVAERLAAQAGGRGG